MKNSARSLALVAGSLSVILVLAPAPAARKEMELPSSRNWTPVISVILAAEALKHDADGPDAAPDKYHEREDCPNDHWIVHGDGHRSRCPWCLPPWDDAGLARTYQILFFTCDENYKPCRDTLRKTLPRLKEGAGWSVGVGAENRVVVLLDDSDEYNTLASRYNVDQIPSFVLINQDGEELRRLVGGPRSPEELMEFYPGSEEVLQPVKRKPSIVERFMGLFSRKNKSRCQCGAGECQSSER